MKYTNYGQRMDGSEQQIQDNQKLLEQIYLHPLTQFQPSNYVNPSHVVYDSQHSRWIDPPPEILNQNRQLNEDYNFPLSNGRILTESYPEVPKSNASIEPYYVDNNSIRMDNQHLVQQTNLEASIATSSSAAGQSIPVNNYLNNHITMTGDQSHGSQNLVNRNMQNTQIENQNLDDQSDSSGSDASETRKLKDTGTTRRKRKPWTARPESSYPRVWTTEQEMKHIDPDYEKNPRLAFQDMTKAKNGMKSFQIDWDQVELLNVHRRNAANEENERMKCRAPGTYVPKFVPKPYFPNARLQECRDEWFRRKQMGDASDSWTNRMRRKADRSNYNPELEGDSVQ
ncbi:uncharacterized protein EAE97_007440 [Botrytis byssoidea]|uniref:Uncharacterized protein n=1 Tax=Botrytis byssoidea TaxID=139641 RepID=A0A9P5IKE2_9HELO|nr:uncharacterized protein EAE97_007440 [Botrytis byssoidea]KAF7939360.1 hypothetical protein EAE97_007440 [Botrytis byssoidea]